MVLEIGVTPYVFRYLLIEYGLGPYKIKESNRKDMRLAFEYWHMKALCYPPSSETHGELYLIKLDIGQRIPNRLYLDKGNIPKKGTFFQMEFWNAAMMYIAGQMDINKDFPERKISKWMALANFLDRYAITEDIYSIESAYRRLYEYERYRAAVYSV